MSGDERPQGPGARGTGEQPRSIAFHWVANMLLASVALFAGVLFGERIPQDQLGTAFVAVAAVALALVPLTRYWERTGIEGRRKAAERSQPDKDADKTGEPPQEQPKESDPPGGDK